MTMAIAPAAPAAPDGDNGNHQERVVTIMLSLLASKWKSCISKVEVIWVDTKLEPRVIQAAGGDHPQGLIEEVMK